MLPPDVFNLFISTDCTRGQMRGQVCLMGLIASTVSSGVLRSPIFSSMSPFTPTGSGQKCPAFWARAVTSFTLLLVSGPAERKHLHVGDG